jgi:hypothetical protein
MCLNMYLFFEENVKGSPKLSGFLRQFFSKSEFCFEKLFLLEIYFQENFSLSILLLLIEK